MDKLDLDETNDIGMDGDERKAFDRWIARTKCFAAWTRRDIAWEAWKGALSEVCRLQSLPQGEAPEIPHNATWEFFTRTVCPECQNRDLCLGELPCSHCSGGYVYAKAQAPGTARSQEAGTGAPGVRECWVKFVDGAPWAVNIRPYHYMENCEWVHMVEATPSNNLEGHNEIA